MQVFFGGMTDMKCYEPGREIRPLESQVNIFAFLCNYLSGPPTNTGISLPI